MIRSGISLWMTAAVCLAAVQHAAAGERLRESPVVDRALTQQGQLTGRCENVNGAACSGAAVGLFRNGVLVAESTADTDGAFAMPGVSTGLYELTAADWRRTVRVWSAETAPPRAHDPIVVVLRHASPSVQSSRPSSAKAESAPSEAPVVWDLKHEWSAEANPQSRQVMPQTTDQIVQTDARILLEQPSLPALPPYHDATPLSDTFEVPLVPAAQESDEVIALPMEPPAAPPAVDNFYAEPVDTGPVTGNGELSCCPTQPPRYRYGPTVGQVVTTSALIAGAIYLAVEIDDNDDKQRRPVSP